MNAFSVSLREPIEGFDGLATRALALEDFLYMQAAQPHESRFYHPATARRTVIPTLLAKRYFGLRREP